MNECSCQNCQEACKHWPGMFSFEQLEKTAKAFKLSVVNFIKKYGVIRHAVMEDGMRFTMVHYVTPALVGRIPGARVPFSMTGQCVFFKEGRCSIHAVKPAECAGSDHNRQMNTDHLLNSWHSKKAQRLIEKVLA